MSMSRANMIAFLRDHFRYDTMNSWNASTSYARRVKLHDLDIPRDLQDRAYDLIRESEPFAYLRPILDEFEDEHDGRWTIGFNGRSGGYMVLYHAFRGPSGHKSKCVDCGNRMYKGEVCGVCGGECVPYEGVEHGTYPGKSLDQGEDFDSWSIDDLRWRVSLVKSFDRACERYVKAFIDFVREHEVVEVDVPRVVQERRVVPVGEGASA